MAWKTLWNNRRAIVSMLRFRCGSNRLQLASFIVCFDWNCFPCSFYSCILFVFLTSTSTDCVLGYPLFLFACYTPEYTICACSYPVRSAFNVPPGTYNSPELFTFSCFYIICVSSFSTSELSLFVREEESICRLPTRTMGSVVWVHGNT